MPTHSRLLVPLRALVTSLVGPLAGDRATMSRQDLQR